ASAGWTPAESVTRCQSAITKTKQSFLRTLHVCRSMTSECICNSSCSLRFSDDCPFDVSLAGLFLSFAPEKTDWLSLIENASLVGEGLAQATILSVSYLRRAH